MKKDIIIFTHSFPYGSDEPFLLAEVKILVNRFRNVIIIPSKKAKGYQQIPDSVEVVTILHDTSHRSLLRIFFENLVKVISIYTWTLVKRDNFKYYLRFVKSFMHYLLDDINKFNTIKRFIIQRNLHSAIFYDYWFVNSTISLSLLRKKGVIAKCICRAHGFDLYDERNFEFKVSFRDFKIRYIDSVYTVSQHGCSYLKSRVSRRYHHKIEYSYLGVEKRPMMNIDEATSNHSRMLIVSCSRMIPLKRVELIPEILEGFNRPVHWVHFGAGPKFKEVIKKAANLTCSTYKLYGSVNNKSIHEFYSKNRVGLFISLSESEGLPVSMMEAIAYGIPIFSTDVGGVKELVNNSVGATFPVEMPPEKISERLDKMISRVSNYDRVKIVDFYKTSFMASTNYSAFINRITK